MKKTIFLLFLLISIGSVFGQTEHSVLETGNWTKIAINETGVYKLSYSDLQAMGIDVSSINPQDIRIFGNGNGMLSEANSDFRYDDIQENAIKVTGEEDGIFNTTDYVLFYAEAPTEWAYNSSEDMFLHQLNYYTDYTYYFLTTNLGTGKRIEEQASSTETPTHTISSFDEYVFLENEEINLLKSGKIWLGENFEETNSYDFTFNFPNMDLSSEVKLKTSAYARSSMISSFDISTNGASASNFTIENVSMSSSTSYFARNNVFLNSFSSTTDEIILNLTYNPPTDTSLGWLDYLTLNARRQLQMTDNQISFRDIESVGANNISQFELNNITSDIQVWDVSDPLNVKEQLVSEPISDGYFKYISSTETLKEFIAFENSGFLSPSFTSNIPNQDLHGLSQADMLIITHPDFETQATTLANHHINEDDLSTHVVIIDEIYNEFSSGAQDVSAIRDFVKIFYDRASNEDEKPKYLLLFGDASYDYKDRIEGNTNYVPVFESLNSMNHSGTFMTDDFFGYLDESEGNIENVTLGLDLGIGRLPVKNIDEASAVVNKIIHYSTSTDTQGKWRNELCFVADDGDGNIHMNQSNTLADEISDSNNCFNINKIYLDNYEKETNGDVVSYPEVNEILKQKFNEGSLIINYTGHGHPNKLAKENILNNDEIDALDNYNNLPFFYAAACNFGKLDDPEMLSGGEKLVLSNQKGAIAGMFSTRISYSNMNFMMNKAFMNKAFENGGHNNHRIGDILMYFKNNVSGNFQFGLSLIGDPALKLAFPEQYIYTEYFDDALTSSPIDTINPYDQLDIEGYIGLENENILSNFDGTLYYKLYNPIEEDTTLANDGFNPFVFNRQDKVVYEGTTEVINGEFTINFVVPSDLSFEIGKGKLSYYANDNSEDALGCFEDFYIGGGNTSIEKIDIGDVKIFPNVTSDIINIELPEKLNSEFQVSIIDITGKQIQSDNFDGSNKKIQIDLSQLHYGVYLVRTTTKMYSFNSKIIKK